MTPYTATDTLVAMRRETLSGISKPTAADRRSYERREASPDPLGMAWIGLLSRLQALRIFRPSATRRTSSPSVDATA